LRSSERHRYLIRRHRMAITRLAYTVALGLVFHQPSLATEDVTDLSSKDLDPEWAAAYLEKQQHRIVMRDGVSLHTTVYKKRDAKESMPIILVRTPFGSHPYAKNEFPGWLGPGAEFLEAGYILVKQDVRGTFMSEGKWQRMTPHRGGRRRAGIVDESTDGYDTIDWLIENIPGNNGRVCLWGGSFDGFYALASMIDPHPNLVCAVIHAPTTDWWWDDAFHNGAVQLAHVFWGFAEFGIERDVPSEDLASFDVSPATGDGYSFFLDEVGPLSNVGAAYFHGLSPAWNDMVAHPSRDTFWQERNIHAHLKSGAPAVLVVGGWFDAEDLYGALATYRSLAKISDVQTYFVMGPWEHTQWMDGESVRVGDVSYGRAHPHTFRTKIQRPFLDFYLKDEGPDANRDGHVDLPQLSMFDTGSSGWTYPSQWPPAGLHDCKLYLQGDTLLASHSPDPSTPEQSQFVSDPASPVPYTENHYFAMDPQYMTADQRPYSRRPDVLSFVTAPLTEAVIVSGPIEANLWVATDQSDADWIVKIIDVQPNGLKNWPDMRRGQRRSGYQMLVRAEILRGRYRTGFAKPEPFRPNEPTPLSVRLNDVQHTFLPGHRIMVQVQSSWFPLFDRNPQAWVDNIFKAQPSDFTSATHTIFHSEDLPSSVTFPIAGSCAALDPAWAQKPDMQSEAD